MAVRSRCARASAFEIGKGFHSSVRIHVVTCEPRTSPAKSNVTIAAMRAAIFRNVAIEAVIPRVDKGSITTPLTHSCGPKWTYCEHRWAISQHAPTVKRSGKD